MSIYASLPGITADEPCGPPWLYQGSHVLPAEEDPRGGEIGLARIPPHITRDGRDDTPEDDRPWPWLRVSLDDGDGLYCDALISPAQARHLADQLTAWADSTGDPRMTDPTAGEHTYLSTACLHAVEPGRKDLHQDCQTNARRYDGSRKIAGQCKWCGARCTCRCHTEGTLNSQRQNSRQDERRCGEECAEGHVYAGGCEHAPEQHRPDNPAPDDALRGQYAAAMREHWLVTNREETDADGNTPCRCGDWREPGPMGSDEDDWDSHIADAALAVRDRRLEQLTAERAQAEETARRCLDQRQEMAAERYAWQERGDRAEADRDRLLEQRGQLQHQLEQQHTALTRVLAAVSGPVAEDCSGRAEAHGYRCALSDIRAAIGSTADAPVDRTTTRDLAALHRSPEDTVTRVISLYDRWVQAGPPPLGTSMSRW